MRWFLATLAIFLISATSAISALDVRGGLVRVVVDETTGCALLYRLSPAQGSLYDSLLFDSDARTSFLTISLDGRKIRLSESQEFRMSIRRLADGANIEFSSPVLQLVQRIEFVKSTDSAIFDGFRITCEVRNLSKRDSKFALRQIWDTSLGEKSGVHFIANGISHFDAEMIFQGETMVPFLISPGNRSSLGLILDQTSRPDTVVVANWKRLSDSLWFYDMPTRGFSHPPYSIHDSAIGLYWNEILLKSGASRSFTHYLLTGGEGQEFAKSLRSGLSIEGGEPANPAATPSPAHENTLSGTSQDEGK